MEREKSLQSSSFEKRDIIALASKKLKRMDTATPLLLGPGAVRPPTQSSSRFGNLSHRSFFSRHNPHPHRVTHIAGALSEAWREELRELTARVEAFSPAETAKEEAATQEKAQRPQRVTQHSAETGRLIPPPSRATARHSSRQLHRKSAKTEGKQAALSCQDQELAVLELLCQILQTYSLMAVQQWLLTAGPREKDIAVGLLQATTATLQLELQVLSTGTGDSAGSQASQSTAGISSGGQRSGRNQPGRYSQRQKQEPVPQEEKPGTNRP
nr:PREDICTED: protein TBATA [Struthio camelus australis]